MNRLEQATFAEKTGGHFVSGLSSSRLQKSDRADQLVLAGDFFFAVSEAVPASGRWQKFGLEVKSVGR